jgi:hypothetical protein
MSDFFGTHTGWLLGYVIGLVVVLVVVALVVPILLLAGRIGGCLLYTSDAADD